MKDQVQLPDYLPSRYRSWYDLYLDILRSAKSQGTDLPDDTIVNLLDYGFEEESLKNIYSDTFFYQEWPLIVIKSRALDDVISQLPTLKELISIKRALPPNLPEATNFINKVLMLCAKKE